MLLQLPTFNAQLALCPVNPATAFTAHEQGHFCSSCQRVVQDFSQSKNPAADLAAARAAAPDGRVCGSFRPAQAQPPPAPALTRRLRWFVMALVLVVGQGLTAREALAQVRRPVPENLRTVAMPIQSEARAAPEQPELVAPVQADEVPFLGMIVEAMPRFRGGSQRELVHYIQQQIHWPKAAARVCAGGRVFASFTVGADGRVSNAHIVKGLHPLLDAEVLRVISRLSGFTPGLQNGQPVAVSFTVPVTFRLK